MKQSRNCRPVSVRVDNWGCMQGSAGSAAFCRRIDRGGHLQPPHILAAASGLALGTRLATASTQGANDGIRIVGVIGTGGRARGSMGELKMMHGVELSRSSATSSRPAWNGDRAAHRLPATCVKDHRRILDDPVDRRRPHRRARSLAPHHDDRRGHGRQGRLRREADLTHHRGGRGHGAGPVEPRSKSCKQARSSAAGTTGSSEANDRFGPARPDTFAHTYWYQHAARRPLRASGDGELDWKAWLGPAKDRPFRPGRLCQWRTSGTTAAGV